MEARWCRSLVAVLTRLANQIRRLVRRRGGGLCVTTTGASRRHVKCAGPRMGRLLVRWMATAVVGCDGIADGCGWARQQTGAAVTLAAQQGSQPPAGMGAIELFTAGAQAAYGIATNRIAIRHRTDTRRYGIVLVGSAIGFSIEGFGGCGRLLPQTMPTLVA
jgi:hypothetical protein